MFRREAVVGVMKPALISIRDHGISRFLGAKSRFVEHASI